MRRVMRGAVRRRYRGARAPRDGNGQEIAAFTSSTILFSTAGLHF